MNPESGPPPGHGQVAVATRILGGNDPFYHFHLPSHGSLLEVMQVGAQHANVALLPTVDDPLDLLHNETPNGQVGPPIDDLQQPVGDYVHRPGTSNRFDIELVLAFRVNVRWAVAPTASMTPRQILALPAIGLNFEEYTLYLPGSNEPLPLDTPVTISRGQVFEAQRDGRYGGRG